MSWPASIFSALLSGLLGLVLSVVIASLAVEWYHIPSREGAAGYYVILIALMGGAAGFVLGLIVSRVMAGGAHPSFLKGLGASLGLVLLIGAAVAGVARSLADVPPTLNGEELLLAVELRWPESQVEAPRAVGTDEPYLSLHSIPHFSHTVRASQNGPLWMEDAHQVEGRWVVPGAVSVFTSRGTRMLSVRTGEERTQGFEVPLPGTPRRRDLEWSDWGPKFRTGVTPPAGLLSFRYRVRKVSEPIRTETVGPFQVESRSSYFYREQIEERTLNVASTRFALRYRERPLAAAVPTGGAPDSAGALESIDDVALLGGPQPAFLIHVDSSGAAGDVCLVSGTGEQARLTRVAEGSTGTQGQLLTFDDAAFRAAGRMHPVRGRIDRVSYARPGLYRIGHAVVDTRRLVVHAFTPDSTAYGIPSVPPLGLSPDERSFVEFGNGHGTDPTPLLLVTDFVGNHTYALPVDPSRMRFGTLQSLDPAWLLHHFEWRRGADGIDRLVERAAFTPLPYRGELSGETDGYSSYRVDRGTEELRAALLDLLVTEFHGVRQPADPGAYELPVLIKEQTVNVAYSSDGEYVMASMTRGAAGDSTLIPRIGGRFDALLATGRYDSLFVP